MRKNMVSERGGGADKKKKKKKKKKNLHQRVEQGHFTLYHNSMLFPHTDVNLTLT